MKEDGGAIEMGRTGGRVAQGHLRPGMGVGSRISSGSRSGVGDGGWEGLKVFTSHPHPPAPPTQTLQRARTEEIFVPSENSCPLEPPIPSHILGLDVSLLIILIQPSLQPEPARSHSGGGGWWWVGHKVG